MPSVSGRKKTQTQALIEQRLIVAGHKAGLSHRQIEILVKLATGDSRKSAAYELKVCHQTVDYHLHRVFSAFKCGTVPEALAILLVF